MPWIKELKMFIIFVSMATELTDHLNFTKKCNSNTNIFFFCEQKYGLCKHILASLHLFSKDEKLKIMKLFRYRLPWQPNHQIVSYFTKKSIFKAKHLPETKDQIDYFSTDYVSAPDFQHQIQVYKWIISIHVTMATKTSYHQRFHKNGIFYEKGIFKANYLLPAQQNMNNFKHILHNIHLQFKHKIFFFKFLIIITMVTEIAKNGVTL